MMIEYINVISLETLDVVEERTGYINVNDIKEITWKKVENTKRYGASEKYYDYHIIVIGQNELAYSVAVCDVDSGNAEWSLYVARIYMNYLREYIDGNIQRLPEVNRLKIIVASCSSSFEIDKIQRDEYIEKLRSWMMKAGYEDCLDIIDIIASPKFKYTIISE